MTARQNIDLDRLVDYKAEYSAVIQKAQIYGDNLVGLCPFHDDRNNSFSVNLITGQWKCFAEDRGGNFITFWSEFYHVDTDEAYDAILRKYGVNRDDRKEEKRSTVGSYTLGQYAFEKRLPEDFLRETCQVTTGKDRDGTTFLKMPYINSNGEEMACRKRYASKAFRWRKGSKGKICLYGEWRLEEIQRAGYAVLVEGESDTHTLWHLGIPAIGVAGASMFREEQAATLQGLKIYLHREPDQGGDTFFKRVCTGLHDGDFLGEVYLWSCKTLGTKDPSELYLKLGKPEAARQIKEALQAAEPVDLEKALIPETIKDAPINLRQPEGWSYSDRGISRFDEKRYAPVQVCRTPIILTKRLKSIETGEEKIEVAFKRDDSWRSATFPRSMIFSSRSITALSDLGCTVTSENAKDVVRFLGALEAENIDVIPKVDATSTFGWQPGRRFIPGHDDGITLDIDPSQRSAAAAYCKSGTFDKWLEIMTPHRQRDIFRFILAASFAAPLLRIVKQRIFFVYNWGGSKGGKTAALKAALSAWGDPERLMVNFNTTQAGLERTAAFYCDLPLGIDERQLAGNKQGSIEQMIYMVASGKGRTRANKTGGVQTTYQWRTVALSTGEEPLSTETSQTGISTRALEIYGGPFPNETEAGTMHQMTAQHHGWAGPAFVERLIALDERQICDAYEDALDYISGVSNGKNGAHNSGIAAVALADALVDSWFFGGSPERAPSPPMEHPPDFFQALDISPGSWRAALEMAANILVEQVESNSQDVNENAVQFVTDWVLSNRAYFGTNAAGTCLGMTSEEGNIAYIFPSMLNQALEKRGFSPRKTLKYMADKGLITTTTEKNGRKIYSTAKWFDNRTCRFIEFHIGKLAKKIDPIDDDPEEMQGSIPGYSQSTFSGFTDLEGGDEELPF